jgi:hypothetical protein
MLSENMQMTWDTGSYGLIRTVWTNAVGGVLCSKVLGLNNGLCTLGACVYSCWLGVRLWFLLFAFLERKPRVDAGLRWKQLDMTWVTMTAEAGLTIGIVCSSQSLLLIF